MTSGVSGVAGEDGKDGIGLVSIEQTTESTGEGEVNVITATMSDGQVSTFRIRNGSAGETGPVGPAGPAGPQGPSGKDGADGKDGVDGTDGVDGKDGADGMDGSVYEYIYFRGFTANDKPFTPMGGNNTDDYVPADTKTVTINGNQVVLV